VQTTNQHLEVYSDRYEFHTNYAVFHEKVRVEQFANQEAKGYLTCARMDVFFSGTNSLDAILAHNGVIISHGENRFTSGEAVYGGTNGLLTLTETPAWQSGERTGKGDRIEVNTGKEEMLVRGSAEMRFPAGEMGDIAMLRPSMAKTNKPAVKPEANRNKMAVITSESYLLSRASAVFSGTVRIDHPQMEMECGNLQIALPQRGNKVDSIVAEEAVRFRLANDEGKTLKGRANKAVYSYTITPSGTNDVLELIGYPVLEDGEGRVFRNDERLVLDVGKGTLLSTGNYHGGIPSREANTNRFDFPKAK
jgi:lipopolysaccharide export system protein LptA